MLSPDDPWAKPYDDSETELEKHAGLLDSLANPPRMRTPFLVHGDFALSEIPLSMRCGRCRAFRPDLFQRPGFDGAWIRGLCILGHQPHHYAVDELVLPEEQPDGTTKNVRMQYIQHSSWPGVSALDICHDQVPDPYQSVADRLRAIRYEKTCREVIG